MTEEYINKKFDFKPAAKVLVIDDSHLNRSFITNAFGGETYDVETAVDAEEGIRKATEWQPELILLDIMMPIMDGFEAASILKREPETSDIPIIFITALDAIQDKLKAFNVGGVDFVTKPFNHKELIARVNTNIALRRANVEKENIFSIAMEERRSSVIARIAAGVSHNFNNMLGVSFGNIMLVESMISEDLDPIAKESLIDVKKSLQRMQDLVQQFLMLANRDCELKGGTPRPQVLDLNEVVDQVCNDLKDEKESYTKPIAVNCEADISDGNQIFCDKNHAREIFNLIMNEAVDTTLGKVRIAIKSIDSEDSAITSCKVHLDGIPVTGEVADAIFEPFALPIANVGAGLSFSVAKHLLELNGAEITSEFLEDNQLDLILRFKNSE